MADPDPLNINFAHGTNPPVPGTSGPDADAYQRAIRNEHRRRAGVPPIPGPSDNNKKGKKPKPVRKIPKLVTKIVKDTQHELLMQGIFDNKWPYENVNSNAYRDAIDNALADTTDINPVGTEKWQTVAPASYEHDVLELYGDVPEIAILDVMEENDVYAFDWSEHDGFGNFINNAFIDWPILKVKHFVQTCIQIRFETAPDLQRRYLVETIKKNGPEDYKMIIKDIMRKSPRTRQ